jgi:hypothetical protein
VEVPKRFADERAAAIIEQRERELRAQGEKVQKTAAETLSAVAETMSASLHLAVRLIPYVPKGTRARLIKDVELSSEAKQELLRWADETPEMATGTLRDLLLDLTPPPARPAAPDDPKPHSL